MTGQSVQAGWLDAIIKKLQLDKLKNISTNKLIEIGIYLGIGFLVGFLFKRCAGYVFVAILTLVGILVLHQLGVVTITVDPAKMQQLFGIQQTVTIDTNLLWIYWGWIKVNMALVLSFSVGFLIGLKIG